MSDRDFDSLFTVDKPIIFNFHGYPWLVHRLTYRRNNKAMHVRGYKEKGNINTPMELAIENETDRFSLAMDVIDRTPSLQKIGGHAKERFRNQQIACQKHAFQNGIDSPEITGWTWPYSETPFEWLRDLTERSIRCASTTSNARPANAQGGTFVRANCG